MCYGTLGIICPGLFQLGYYPNCKFYANKLTKGHTFIIKKLSASCRMCCITVNVNWINLNPNLEFWLIVIYNPSPLSSKSYFLRCMYLLRQKISYFTENKINLPYLAWINELSCISLFFRFLVHYYILILENNLLFSVQSWDLICMLNTLSEEYSDEC